MAEVSVLREKIRAVLPDVKSLRHQLHQIPEIALKEYKTSARIREYLEKLGLPILPSTLETDVTAVLKGGKPGPVVLLRADIDALPITETTGVPYASKHPGFAHSCGHDGHMAILLGTAAVLSQMRDQIAGTVKFLFQPAEESEAGAKSMVKAGYLEKEPKASEAYALHGWPCVPAGAVECCTGPIMAAINDFEITLTGAGGHGAVPERAVDLISAASRFILGMKEYTASINTPENPVVCSVCTILGGSIFNVFPDKVVIRGTTRYLDESVGDRIREKMRELLDKHILPAGGKYHLGYPKPDYVPTNNDKDLFKRVKSVAEKYLGTDKWNGSGKCSMCGEDFGFILKEMPGVYFRLGMGENYPSLHDSAYNFNDDALESGILMMCGLVLER